MAGCPNCGASTAADLRFCLNCRTHRLGAPSVLQRLESAAPSLARGTPAAAARNRSADVIAHAASFAAD